MPITLLSKSGPEQCNEGAKCVLSKLLIPIYTWMICMEPSNSNYSYKIPNRLLNQAEVF